MEAYSRGWWDAEPQSGELGHDLGRLCSGVGVEVIGPARIVPGVVVRGVMRSFVQSANKW